MPTCPGPKRALMKKTSTRRKPWCATVPTYPRVPKDTTRRSTSAWGRTGLPTRRNTYTPSARAFPVITASQAPTAQSGSFVITTTGISRIGFAHRHRDAHRRHVGDPAQAGEQRLGYLGVEGRGDAETEQRRS